MRLELGNVPPTFETVSRYCCRIANVPDSAKKIFPIASIFTRTVDDAMFGAVISSEPVLGVLAASTVGNVNPPSVDKLILTFVTLMGAAVLFETLQLSSVDAPGIQSWDTSTANGSGDPPTTCTTVSLDTVAPPPL